MERIKVPKNNPELLDTLKQLEALINTYDVDNVYNMDETGSFFRMVRNLALFISGEDIATARGKSAEG